jgi:uncharacterized protein YjiS (DUF1127 family)
MFSKLIRYGATWIKTRADINLVESFDDHLLADMNIERSTIRSRLWGRTSRRNR